MKNALDDIDASYTAEDRRQGRRHAMLRGSHWQNRSNRVRRRIFSLPRYRLDGFSIGKKNIKSDARQPARQRHRADRAEGFQIDNVAIGRASIFQTLATADRHAM